MANAVVAIFGAVGGLGAWWQSRRNAEAAKRIAAVTAAMSAKATIADIAARAAIQDVHASVNGQLEASRKIAASLLSTSIDAARAEGVIEGEARDLTPRR
jgi:hypothetical protein